MEKNSAGKREREEEEESSEDITVGELRKKIDTYLATAQERMLKKCTYEPAPKGKGLIEDCQLYNGGTTNSKYAQIYFNGKLEMVHRVALMIALGVLLLPKTNVNGEPVECGHKCDNPRCCEPSHLYLATKAENGADKAKNGLMKGEKNPNAKIKAEVAQEIKFSKGFGTQPERAKEFGVTKSIVRDIDCGNSWADLPDRDGKTSEEQRVKRNKQVSLNNALAKEKPWTREQLDEAQAKFNNSDYVKIDTEHSYMGTYCCLWIRNIIGGYPHTTINGICIGAHIVACTIGNDYVRLKDLEAAHECGNKLCVNSEHLTFKTRKENMADKFEHGTQPLKLSSEQVGEIRKRYENGETQTFLAEVYGVSQTTISDIVNMKTRTIK